MESLYADKIENTAHFCYATDGNLQISQSEIDVLVTIKSINGPHYKKASSALEKYGDLKIINSPVGIHYLSISPLFKSYWS